MCSSPLGRGQATETANCKVNGAMLRNLLEVVGSAPSLRHVALTTGLKHYLGPFEAYAKIKPDTPFREDQERLPYENFYYVQEDILWDYADRFGFTWSVHRAAYGHRLGDRQRNEHGCDAGHLRRDLPGDRSTVRLPGFPRAVQRGDRCHGRPDPGPPARVGSDHSGGRERGVEHRERRPVPVAAYVGALSPTAWVSSRPSIRGIRHPSRSRWSTLLRCRYPDRRAPRPDEIPGRHAGVLVAQRPRPRPDHRDVHRHDEEPSFGFTGYQPTDLSFLDLFDRLREERIIPAHPGQR